MAGGGYGYIAGFDDGGAYDDGAADRVSVDYTTVN
jgi:hypothetical protein